MISERLCRQMLIGLGAGTILSAILVMDSARSADAALVAAAEQEGQVVVYGDSFTMPLITKSFNAKYPKIKTTTAIGDAWQIYNRFIAENSSGRPLMDALYQAEDTIITARNAGQLAEFKSGEEAKLSKLGVPKGGYYYRGNGNMLVFAWNREAMGKLPVPKDWTDYLNPPAAWEGLIATTNPGSSSATFAAVSAIYQKYGPEKGGDILKGLRKAKAELNSGMGVMLTKLQTGERPLDFFNTTSAVAVILNQGAPIQIMVPESGAVPQFNAIAISKTAPHPNAARLFAEHILSEEMQTVLAEAGVYALREGVATPKNLPSLSQIKLLDLDLDQALRDRETILNWWAASTGFSYR